MSMRASITKEHAVTLRHAAEAALKEGDWSRAREIVRGPADSDHDSEASWVWQALAAESEEEYLLQLSRLVEKYPQHTVARQCQYAAMQRLLAEDPYLEHAGEDEAFYRVRTATGALLTIPKDRVAPPPFPPPQTTPLQRAWRWLAVAIIGLAPAGLGAVFAAPMAAFFAVQSARRPLNRADRVRVRIALLGAFLVWSTGLFLFILLIMQMV
jgi:hypothetical protein